MQMIKFVLLVFTLCQANAWVSPTSSSTKRASTKLGISIGKNYTPKWKKLETLADKEGISAPSEVGLTGQISVVFKQGDQTLQTVASVGDPIRDVASQAGQFIKYGCGKGECGTCQALCNGKYITPCTAVVPGNIADGEEYVIQVKEVKSKGRSSGKFYSVRSFIMGFYNNVLGMIGFVKDRRLARKNYNERIEYENMIAKIAAEKRAAREAAAKQQE
mmetsp:Transcript_15682/g.19901  ORF Transcript_15682/g.19901 Transcript_15682/m.19901 type:complete len:218 (+) Transcript_15682:132-785(+)